MVISQKEKQVINDEFTQIGNSARKIQVFYKHWQQQREIKSDQTPVIAEGLGKPTEMTVVQNSSKQDSLAFHKGASEAQYRGSETR